MDDPVAEIRDVIRGVTEPYEASTLAANVEKFYTKDAVFQHPFLTVARSPSSRDAIKGIYKILRIISLNQKIQFHAVMFNEDKTQVAIDLTEHMDGRYTSKSVPTALRLIVLLDLVKGADGKYRISRQEDNFPSSTPMLGAPFIPGLKTLYNAFRHAAGFTSGVFGSFCLARGWFGP